KVLGKLNLDGRSKESLCGLFHFAQYHRRYLFRGEGLGFTLILDLQFRFASLRVDHLEGPVFHVRLHSRIIVSA
uniref:Uncharacterized protein n=1 Tax=Parascaris univalens TaxID=6257 RepID=A0A915CCX9_PARUN